MVALVDVLLLQQMHAFKDFQLLAEKVSVTFRFP